MFADRLASAEFLAVDTETNGLAGDACELTEVGCVLVGGGELHDEWSSLVGVELPLGHGIQRFTGISQAMVDAAPPPTLVLPELAERLRGRVLVAHSASFDVRVLRQAFERARLPWPEPPVLCTVALARRFAPLQRRRGLATLAAALGIDVEGVHRALPDARTCARVLCALFGRLCAHAATIGDAVALLAPRRRGARPPRPARAGARPDMRALPHAPGVYVFRDADGRPLYVGKSVDLRSRARSHFTAAAGWTEHADHVDHQPTASELGALLLEDRLIKALRPPGNVRGKADPDGYVYIRCRLDIAFPILELAREPAAGHAVCVGPVRGRAAAAELIEQLNSLFGLRHCGRALPRRAHPSAYGQMGRCLSPCLRDLDPNAYRERLDAALALFAADGGRALLAHVDAQIGAASAARRYERAAWLQRRRERLQTLLSALGGVLRAIHAGARLVLATHANAPGRADALWIAGGRLVDFAPDAPADPAALAARSARVLARAPAGAGPGGWLPAGEVAETRLAGAWIAANAPPQLELGAGVGPAEHAALAAAARPSRRRSRSAAASPAAARRAAAAGS